MLEILKDKVFILLSVVLILGFLLLGRYNLVVNYTHSLPQKIFIVDKKDNDLHVGNYVAFRSYGLPNISNNHRILKVIKGVAGDQITVKDNYVLINNNPIAKIYYKMAFWGKINPIESTVIPKDCYFMSGIATTSFDSRYKEFGLICKKLIVGRAYPLF